MGRFKVGKKWKWAWKPGYGMCDVRVGIDVYCAEKSSDYFSWGFTLGMLIGYVYVYGRIYDKGVGAERQTKLETSARL